MADVFSPISKRVQIDKANSRTVAYVGIASFILIFSLVATKTLVGQAAYQNKVISAKKTAVKQLKDDISATDELKKSYGVFTESSQNVLGGNASALGGNNGNNAKIVLDALPSSYDFPGLTTTIETLVKSQNVKISSLTGIDDEVAQSANQSSVTPQPQAMPFTVTVEGDYQSLQNVIKVFERSIRPIEVQALDFSGTKGNLKLEIKAQTYYQPAKSLNIKKQVMK